MPIDRNADGTPETHDNFPPHHIFVGAFFTASDDEADNSAYIISSVNPEHRTFRAFKLSTMTPCSYNIPFDVRLMRNPFRESIQPMPHGAGIAYLEGVLGDARKELSFWKSLWKAYLHWHTRRFAHKSFLLRYRRGPLMALNQLSASKA